MAHSQKKNLPHTEEKEDPKSLKKNVEGKETSWGKKGSCEVTKVQRQRTQQKSKKKTTCGYKSENPHILNGRKAGPEPGTGGKGQKRQKWGRGGPSKMKR